MPAHLVERVPAPRLLRETLVRLLLPLPPQPLHLVQESDHPHGSEGNGVPRGQGLLSVFVLLPVRLHSGDEVRMGGEEAALGQVKVFFSRVDRLNLVKHRN